MTYARNQGLPRQREDLNPLVIIMTTIPYIYAFKNWNSASILITFGMLDSVGF